MYQEFKSFILNLYNNYVRNGETKEDSLALVVYIIKVTFMLEDLQPLHYGKTEDFALLDKGNKYYFENLEKIQKFKVLKYEQIKQAVMDLVSSLDDIYSSDKKRTNRFTAKLVQNIIQPICKNKTLIDLSLGKGTLLENLSNTTEGQDIDLRQVIIAEFFLSKYNEIKNIFVGDSLENSNIFKKNNEETIYIFDPPMGDLRTYPKGNEWQNTNILKTKPDRLQSEILFLMSVLIHANDNDYFIGLFPENILTKNNKEYNDIRKYLIKNSLIAVIKVPTNHILLIGQKLLTENKSNQIPVLNINSPLNQEQLQFISKEITKKKDFNFEQFYKILPEDNGTFINDIGFESFNKDWSQIFAYKIFDRQELINNKQSIYIPVIKSYEEKHIATPKEIFENITDKENEIKTTFENLKSIISDLPEMFSTQEREKEWFEKEDLEITPETEALRYFYNRHEKEILLSENINPEMYSYIKILFSYNRLTFLKTKIKIDFTQSVSNLECDWEEFYKVFNPLKDKRIVSILDMVQSDNNIKLVFENICQYWMLNQDEEKTIIKKKSMKTNELKRCLRVSEELGLLIFNKHKVKFAEEEDKSEIYLYNSYLPNIKYLDTLKFKEQQDV